MRKILLFTDLDGTLIDHHTYSASVVTKTLKRLEEKGIPVIFCSSKTFAEQLHLQVKLGINHPFIFENGSAIAIPKGYFTFLSKNTVQISESRDMVVLAKRNLADITEALNRINETCKSNLYGYAKSNDKKIAEITGLKGEAVQRAKDRWFTESLFSGPSNLQTLEMLEQFGLIALQGGRFLTVQDKDVDKGKAVRFVTRLFQDLWQVKPLTVGIGDSPNDAPFLTVVERPFLVQKQDGKWANMAVAGLTKIGSVGPYGFLEAVKGLLEEA